MSDLIEWDTKVSKRCSSSGEAKKLYKSLTDDNLMYISALGVLNSKLAKGFDLVGNMGLGYVHISQVIDSNIAHHKGPFYLEITYIATLKKCGTPIP
jgi:hypothetical protein